MRAQLNRRQIVCHNQRVAYGRKTGRKEKKNRRQTSLFMHPGIQIQKFLENLKLHNHFPTIPQNPVPKKKKKKKNAHTDRPIGILKSPV